MDQPTNCATTDHGQCPDLECRDCGWQVVRDLTMTWVLGRPVMLCTNPWKCWENRVNLREELGGRGLLAEGSTTG